MCVALFLPSTHLGLCFSVLISGNWKEVPITVEAHMPEKSSQPESSKECIRWLLTSHWDFSSANKMRFHMWNLYYVDEVKILWQSGSCSNCVFNYHL